MHSILPSLALALTALSLTLTRGSAIPHQSKSSHNHETKPNTSGYAGYLLSTFTDPNPSVFWYLSNTSDPLAFKPLNGGDPILESNVGTGAVRDIFLTSNKNRTEFYIVATGLSPSTLLQVAIGVIWIG